MGVFEIAQAAGVTPQAVSNWVARNSDFPKPLATLASGAVWDGAEVRAWLVGRQLISDAAARQRALEAFVVGEEYSFDAIAGAFGGQSFGYLPQVGSRVVCGRFTMEMNPH